MPGWRAWPRAGTRTGGVTDSTWDAQDRLVQIDFPDLTFAAYRCDGLGRRIEKDVAGVTPLADFVDGYDGLGLASRAPPSSEPLVVAHGGTQNGK